MLCTCYAKLANSTSCRVGVTYFETAQLYSPTLTCHLPTPQLVSYSGTIQYCAYHWTVKISPTNWR